MQIIQAPLDPTNTGESVTNLQNALLFILDKRLIRLTSDEFKRLVIRVQRDREVKVYGDGTMDAVRVFREQFVTPGEIVDEPTAEALNKLLKELGAFNAPETEWIVRGQVVDGGTPLNNILVSVFDRDLFFRREGASTGQLLGAGNTQKLSSKNENGWFEFSYTTAKFAAGDIAPKAGEPVPDLIFALSKDGQPIEKFQLYRLPDGKEVNEEILVSDDDMILGIQARKVEEVRIVVGSTLKRQTTEFEQIIQAIVPLLPEQVPSGADASQVEALVGAAMLRFDEDKHRDVSFAARETGINRLLIERLRDAFEQAFNFDTVPAWAFFGLASINIPLTTVDSMTLEELVSALKPLQPSYDKRELKAVANSLKQLVQEQNIRIKITDMKASVGDLLQPILTTEARLNSFLDAYARHEGDIENFWKNMGNNPEFHAVIPKIQINLQLSQLTLGNKGLITALQQAGIKNTRQLVDLPAERWDALALENKAGIPLHITGKDDLERSKIYSRELQTLVELSFPTDVIKKSIQKPEVKAFLNNNPKFDFTLIPVEAYLEDQGEHAFQGIENTEPVKTHLRKLQRLYTLTTNTAGMNVLMDFGYESAHQIAKLSAEDFRRSLGGKISEGNAQVYHAKALAVSDASVMVYQQLRDIVRAQSVSAVENLRGHVNARAGRNFANNAVASPNVLPGIPDWESLFGSLGMCACQHCKSVYSPAAYFVDLLHILLGQNKGAPRIEIFRRRPDLKFTKLSCQHTDTLIPYIDLVNEVLETYVAQDTVGDKAASDHALNSTNDTSNFSASDLAANPQHPNTFSSSDAVAAYDKLKGAIFPLSLPFDMDMEVARQFLQEQGSSRFELLDTFKIASANARAAERLGMSIREFEILTLKQLDGVTNALITKADGTIGAIDVSDLWGNPPTPAGSSLGDVLANVRIFLDATNIAYTDLVSLLKTRFLNPNFPINVFLQELSKTDRDAWLLAHPAEDQLALKVIELGATNPKAPCDLNQTKIKHLNGDFLSDEELSHFNRFIRLWKKLGCSIFELDGLLMSLNPVGSTTITPKIIQDLSVLWQLHQELDLPLDQVAVLIGNIPTYGKDSLFAKLFLNKAILQIDDKFVLKIDQSEIEHFTELLELHVPAIQAAFQISEEQLNHVIIYTGLDITVDTLTVENLSKIYRYIIFAKGLRLKVKDLITWLNLIPQTPWLTVAELAKTKEKLQKFNRYGFKADDFSYIFNNLILVGKMLPPKDEVIRQSFKTLFEGLQKISQENKPSDGIVSNDFLRRTLGNLLDLEETTRIVGILDGTNTLNTFSGLITPKISENYKDILLNYLTPADVGLLAATVDIPDRLKKYWDKVKVRLLPVLRKTFIQQHLTSEFKTESPLITYFLKDISILKICLDVETETPASEKAYFDTYHLLYKCLWLIKYLQLTEKELSYFQGNPNFNNFNWKDLHFSTWLRIADFVALRDALPVSEKDLLSVFEAAKTGGSISTEVIKVTGWDKANVEFFVNKFPATDFLNEIALFILEQQIDLSLRIGVSIEKMESWASDHITHDQAQDIKRSLKTKYDENTWIEVSTRVHNRIRNHLRDALVAYLLQEKEIKAAGLKDTNDLYGYFLIDMEMSACMLTSRLKQAIASVQLFVQRCLLNLESHKSKPEWIISPNMIDAKQWEWMRIYRVWEANRKVFLYPENWIEPELRDNKSPFFKELESELLQGEVTNESAEKALMNYLEKLHDVGRLDICGTYEDNDAQELHVFGRTFNSSPQYFYRKLDLKTQVWTAWEKVQLDIQGNEEGDSAGVHIMPVVWNRRLYLFWPIFIEKQDKAKQKEEDEKLKRKKKEREREREDWDKINLPTVQSNTQKINAIETDREKSISFFKKNGFGTESIIAIPPNREVRVRSFADVNKIYDDMLAELPKVPQKPEPLDEGVNTNWSYYEVKLAWSEYRQNRWANKKTSSSFIITSSNAFGALPTWIYRFSLELGSALKIKLLFHAAFSVFDIPPFPSTLFPQGEFQLNCNGKITALSQLDNGFPFQIIPLMQVNFYQGALSAWNIKNTIILWNQGSSIPFTLLSNRGKSKVEVLNKSESEFKLLFSADHDVSDNSTSRFIYQDHKRNYYVEPQFYLSAKSLQTSVKSIISRLAKEVEDPLVVIDKGDPAVSRASDRFNLLSAVDIRSAVENRQVTSSTAMQIRAIQNLTVSSTTETQSQSLSFPATNIRNTYLKPHFSDTTKLKFKPFFHAYVCKFMDALNGNGIDGLLNLYNQLLSDLPRIASGSIGGGSIPKIIPSNFEKFYGPNNNNVDTPYPMEEVDFSLTGAYSLYNWELFFHIPMLLANRLSKNQRFAEATRWYHFVFNPTTNDSLSSSARYWQVIPLRNTSQETLEALFDQLALPAGDPNRREFEDAITAWRKAPFNPHLIARMRLSAYQKNVVLKYLDNLIAWADTLFRQDTIESINEATQLYILAAELLGRRQEKVPERGTIKALSYDELEKSDKGLDAFSNTLVKFETIFPFYNLQAIPAGAQGTGAILNTATNLYFCLPDNDKLLGYWDTVADRLFKIRHCQTIEGVERQLALFEPPIDPALFVRAVAGGVDIGSVLADLNAPLPYYRFNYIVMKALEICSELKSLGNSLLSALEKKDNEALSIMRTQHEVLLLSLAKTVRKLQTKEAQRGREGLEKTRAVTELRADFYTQLIKGGLNSSEKEQQLLSFASIAASLTGQGFLTAAALAQPIPDSNVGVNGGVSGGPTASQHIGGGTKTAKALSAFGSFFNMLSTLASYSASSAQTNAGYQRRTDDWKLQRDLASKELAQIDKQILASEIREQISEQELSNHEQQIENASQVEEFYRTKFTQEELYGWMVGEISTIYFQCYQLAYDLAKKAEKTYRYELGLPTSNFVQFGIWDSFRKGLMSGERLYLCLKQMEKSYMDQNRREFEITKNISLILHDPMALITLKETGTCLLELPETLFDVDFPGHYMRRIKSVSITIPCVAGPYTGVNCTLTLLSSETRTKSTPQIPYAQQPNDNRFVQNFAATQSIATSTGQNDSGLFELNFRDERYLPFEGHGVISRWRVELPSEFCQFDYQTISDVVLHLKYTARDGGKQLRAQAEENFTSFLKDKNLKGRYPEFRAFSLRHEYPTEWQKLLTVTDNAGDHIQSFLIDKQRFPFAFKNGKIIVNRISVFGYKKSNATKPILLNKLILTSPNSGEIEFLDSVKIKEITSVISKLDGIGEEIKNLGLDKNEVEWLIKVKKENVDACLKKLEDIFLLFEYTVDI